MIEVYPNILLGSQEDYEEHVAHNPLRDYKAVIHACKEPYHRDRLGYSTRGAPLSAGDDYYFIEDILPGYNVGKLYLNMIDPNEMRFVPEVLFTKSFEFINKYIPYGRILIHCNRGESRSAGIVIAYLNRYTDFFKDCNSLEEQLCKFKSVYPRMKLGKGVYERVKHLYEAPYPPSEQYS